MTIFSNNSIFQPTNKFIKFNNKSLNVINGANNLANLPLCGIKINYEQYQRISVEIPKGQIDYLLSFPMMGIKPIFLAITPKYVGTDTSVNFLKWKFIASSDTKMSMTNILMLSGTTTNPVQPILIDNPNADYPVILDILVTAMSNDYLNDITASLYLNNLLFTHIHTFEETNSQTLAYFNSLNELVGTTDISDIVNITRIEGQNRIIIDEASVTNIVLDFVSEYDTLQALSAINWLLLDPANRALPQPPDLIAPIITYTNDVIANGISINVGDYNSNTFTKQDFINFAILSIIDNRDGNIAPLISDITFRNNTNYEIINILDSGDFTATIKVSDIAGNITIETISIIAENTASLSNPPIYLDNLVFTNIHTLNETNSQILAYYNSLNELVATTNISDIINIERVNNINRIIIDDASPDANNIILDFVSEFDTLQTLSAINWLLMEPINRLLPQPADLQSPIITYTPNVISNEVSILLSAYISNTFAKQDFIDLCIESVIDNVDGAMYALESNIIFKNSSNIEISTITLNGTYTGVIEFSDIAGNITTQSINIIAI